MVPPNEIKVLSTTAMKRVFEALAAGFESKTGNRLVVSLGPSTRLEKRLAEGDAADVVILADAGAKELAARGILITDTLCGIARSSIGVAVPKGAPRPDIGSVEGFKRALLAAKFVAVSRPVGGGQSGAHMAKVFERLGIADAMAAKAKYGEGGAKGLAGLVVLRGEAEIGIQQMSELLAVEGIEVVGPLPSELQHVTLFTAAIATRSTHAEAARAVIDCLTTPDVTRAMQSAGLDPV